MCVYVKYVLWRAQRGPSCYLKFVRPPTLVSYKNVLLKGQGAKHLITWTCEHLAPSVYSLTSVQSCFSPPIPFTLWMASEYLTLQTLSKQLRWKNSTCPRIPPLQPTFPQVWGLGKEYTDKKPCPMEVLLQQGTWEHGCLHSQAVRAGRAALPLIFLPLGQVWWLLQKQEEGCHPVMTKWQARGKA